jgi:hypothetical protein
MRSLMKISHALVSDTLQDVEETFKLVSLEVTSKTGHNARG